MTSVYEKYETMSLTELRKAYRNVSNDVKKFFRPLDNLLLMYLGELILMKENQDSGVLSEYWDGRDSKEFPDARFYAPSWYFHRYLANKRRRKLDGEEVNFDEPAVEFRANNVALIPMAERRPLVSNPEV